MHIFITTSGGFNHYEYTGGAWHGEPKSGTFLSTPSAFQDSSGNFQVFLQSTGGITQYTKYTNGVWGSGSPAINNSIISPPSAFQDPSSGAINFFFNTTGGMEHYQYSGGNWQRGSRYELVPGVLAV